MKWLRSWRRAHRRASLDRSTDDCDFGELANLTDRVRLVIEKKSHDMHRAEAMGFSFSPIKIDRLELSWRPTLFLSGTFTCVCGREERYTLTMVIESCDVRDEQIAFEFDIARRLREHGSFSYEHLVADGYSHEQATQVVAKGSAFDHQLGTGQTGG